MHKKIVYHFYKNDIKLHKLALKFPQTDLKPTRNYFKDLTEAIVCQQLSEKAGAVIWSRFRALFSNKQINPNTVRSKTIPQLRKSGISNSKAGYIQNIARAFIDKQIMTDKFNNQTDNEIKTDLIKIKGIGPWTAEMFLIFSLGREDIFSIGDLGLRRAINLVYGLDNKLSEAKIEQLVQKWTPYRSYACLLLWKSLNQK